MISIGFPGGGLHLTSPPRPSALQFLTLERSDMDENYGRVVANIFPQKKPNQTKQNVSSQIQRLLLCLWPAKALQKGQDTDSVQHSLTCCP